MAFKILSQYEIELLTPQKRAIYEEQYKNFLERKAFVERLEQLEKVKMPAFKAKINDIKKGRPADVIKFSAKKFSAVQSKECVRLLNATKSNLNNKKVAFKKTEFSPRLVSVYIAKSNFKTPKLEKHTPELNSVTIAKCRKINALSGDKYKIMPLKKPNIIEALSIKANVISSFKDVSSKRKIVKSCIENISIPRACLKKLPAVSIAKAVEIAALKDEKAKLEKMPKVKVAHPDNIKNIVNAKMTKVASPVVAVATNNIPTAAKAVMVEINTKIPKMETAENINVLQIKTTNPKGKVVAAPCVEKNIGDNISITPLKRVMVSASEVGKPDIKTKVEPLDTAFITPAKNINCEIKNITATSVKMTMPKVPQVDTDKELQSILGRTGMII